MSVDPDEIQQQNIDWERISPDVPMINISMVSWPTVKHYGSDHHSKIAVLATHIGRSEELPKKEINALWCAAMFHDVCREQQHGVEDAPHAMAGANYANKILKLSDYKHDDEMINRACWLIANHSKPGDNINDPALRCLIDADRLEVARIDPMSVRGATLVKEVCASNRMLTNYGKNPRSLANWLKFRGWG